MEQAGYIEALPLWPGPELENACRVLLAGAPTLTYEARVLVPASIASTV